MKLVIEVTLADKADPWAVADALLDFLCDTDDTETPGVVSFDGCEPAGE